MSEALSTKPKVFQRDNRWYVGWSNVGWVDPRREPSPLTHYVTPKIEYMCASFDDALIYAGYLASTRRDGVKELDLPLIEEWRAS